MLSNENFVRSFMIRRQKSSNENFFREATSVRHMSNGERGVIIRRGTAGDRKVVVVYRNVEQQTRNHSLPNTAAKCSTTRNISSIIKTTRLSSSICCRSGTIPFCHD